MSQCVTFTLPSFTIPRSARHGGPLRMPAGQVGVVRPTAALVTALLLDRDACLAAVATRGLTAAVVGPLWDAMTAWTEVEAVRVIAARDIPRVCTELGVDPTSVERVTLHAATGLLDPWDDSRRRFRNCWRQPDLAPPAVDMPLARTQRMTEVRAARARQLAQSDLEFLRAQETGDVVMQTKLKTYRQQLHDLPATAQPRVDALTTPEQLAAWEPTWPIDPTV